MAGWLGERCRLGLTGRVNVRRGSQFEALPAEVAPRGPGPAGRARHQDGPVRDDPDDEVPPPSLVAAWLALGCLAPERVPFWAARWLADGLDGPALRALAGVSGKDAREVRDLLAAALQEAGVYVPDPQDLEAVRLARRRSWVRVTYNDIARLCTDGRAGPRWAVDKVYEIVNNNNFDDDVTSPPLARVFGLYDEWGAYWARPDAELEEGVRSACHEQLASIT